MTAKGIQGIRVLDLTRVWAGPLAGRMLADTGAEVVLIEGPLTIDLEALETRMAQRREGAHFPYYPDGDPGDEPWDRMGTYNDFHRNKLGISLDLTTPQGQDVFKRLVKISDVVLENYTPRVMANFGLEYAVLSEINPSLIMISMPGYGNSGPYRDYPAFGTSVEQHAGFSGLMGYADSGPYRTQSTYTDPVAAINAASAVMLALFHRRRTGRGQYIELAQIETSVCFLGEPILDFAMNRRKPERRGNRHEWMAPHGAYQCLGEDNWLSIAIANDEEWRAFADAIGRPQWTLDPRFEGQANRWRHQDELDERIAEWASGQEHHAAMHLLQRAGVAAAAVLNARELLEDPHLAARGYFRDVTHPKAGTHPYPGPAVRLSDTAMGPALPSPCIGQHSRYVLAEVLGMADEEITSLFEEGIVSEGPKTNIP